MCCLLCLAELPPQKPPSPPTICPAQRNRQDGQIAAERFCDISCLSKVQREMLGLYLEAPETMINCLNVAHLFLNSNEVAAEETMPSFWCPHS